MDRDGRGRISPPFIILNALDRNGKTRGGSFYGEYLGTPATGKRISMRVMDFGRRENNLLMQNWVFIDLPELLLQFGVDLFARRREQRARYFFTPSSPPFWRQARHVCVRGGLDLWYPGLNRYRY